MPHVPEEPGRAERKLARRSSKDFIEETAKLNAFEASCDSLQLQHASSTCKGSGSEEPTCLSQPVVGLFVTRQFGNVAAGDLQVLRDVASDVDWR